MDKIYDFNQLIVPHFFDVSNAPSIPEKFFALGRKSLYYKDTVIIKYGEKLNCIYYIHSGSILGFRQDNEDKMSLAYIIKNGFFGEGWFFSQRNSRDEVIIGDDSIITMFPKDVVDHLITYPEVVKNFLFTLGVKTTSVETKFENFKNKSVKDRLKIFITNQFSLFGDSNKIELKLNQKDIANIISAHPVSISRAFSELKKEMDIEISRNKIIISK